MEKVDYKSNFKYDASASIAVLLVAIPLCLGIAHASGAPLISGLITGVVGGIVVGFLSKSHLSVTGPAAGLTAIVLSGISELGTFEAFLLATVFAGIFQIILGVIKAGVISSYIPNAVIKGMLSAIGIIILLKQFPHMIGYDIEEFGVFDFLLKPNNQTSLNPLEHENTFTILLGALNHFNFSILAIGLISLAILVIWDKTFAKKYKTIPGALIAVLVGTFISFFYSKFLPDLALTSEHLVRVPLLDKELGILGLLTFPDFSQIFNPAVYTVALTIAMVASIETLLCVEATDRIDPEKRQTPKNRELLAQGVGNSVAGLIGGLPLTSVIVRSSVNIAAGGKTKVSAILHGVLLLLSITLGAKIINLIPLSSLAAILVYTGYKLAHPSQLKQLYNKGYDQLLPYVITISAVVLTDLMVGVFIGIIFSLLLIIRNIYYTPSIEVKKSDNNIEFLFGENITFFHKAKIVEELNKVPDNSHVQINFSKSVNIDKDIIETINEFIENSKRNNITVDTLENEKALLPN